MVGKVLYIKYKEIVDGQIVEKVRYAVDRWQADDKYMGESFITFTVKSSKPIAFSVGDYCEYRGETYTLNYIPSVSQRANIGGSGEAFVYEQVKMDSPREELDRAIMLDVTPTTGDYIAALGTNYTGSAQFQLYCGETTVNGRTLTPVCALAAKMQANLDRAFPDKGWKVLVDTTSTHEEAGQQVLNTHSDEKTLTFDNTTIANALAEVKNTFEIDFAVKGRTIYIGYTFGAITGNDDGDYYYFGYGKGYLSEDNQGKALFELKRTSDSGQKIVTRLRALGSTKNMPYRYYNKKYNLSQSLFPMNLQLPDTFETPEVKAKHNKERKAVYPWIRDVLGDTNDAYIDKNDNCLDTVEGLREDCMRWDGTNADLKEIYPSIEEVTYGELRAALCEDQDGNKGSSAFPHYGDNERVDEILDIDTDTNVGDGILTESDSTKQTASDTDVRLSSSETASSLVYMGSGYISKEKEVMNISSQYAGNYIISNSHLWFRASYSLGRHQSENITKTCKVAYQIKVWAKDLSTSKESVICTYVSDFKEISNRDSKEYEVEVAKLPDVDAAVQKVEKITVTNPSDIRITFALIVKDIDYSYDQWNVNWNLGLSMYETPDTDTEWTPSLIWDLEGSASTFMKNPFHVYVKDMGFDFVAAFGTSDTPKIAMKSGMCVAREFTIGNNPQKVEYTKNGITYKAWRLTLAKAEDSSLKTYYPSENFPLAAGDNFVIIGIEMPDVYIQAASMKLLVEATKALADVCDTKHEYEPSVDDIYIQRNYDRCEEQGDVTKSVYWKLGAGMKFPFFGIAEEGKETPDMFSMIIDTLSIREGEGLTPKISIKLSEDFQQSTLQKLTRTVTSITNGSIFKATSIGNGGGLDESSVRAIVSEFTKRRFLSKLNDDVAAGVITFLKGTNWGSFTSETGAAMTVDPTTGQTYMEVDRLKVRLKAFFEQLEVQKVGYVGGKLIVTKGQGVDILDVENIYDTEGNVSAYRCYFLGEQEGRRIDNLLRVDDQMICKDENISEGSTDGATNKYYWRLATAVSSDVVKRGNNVCHWVDLSATDCDTNSDVPSVGDTICHLGNRTDVDRQGAEVLSVVDANSPSFTIYAGINSYSLVNKEYIDMGVINGKAYCNIYGSTYIGDRERSTGYLRWNDDTKTFEIKGTIDISSPLSSGGTIGGAIDNAANAYKDDFSSFTSNVNEIIGGFQAQIDGVIETWFYDPEPKLDNLPASEWKDNDTKDKHLGDLYYSKDGLAYRFQKEGDIYKWVRIDDTAITSALKEAKAAKDAAAAAQGTADTAQTTANSKMKVFVKQPTNNDEYSVGDMWVNATYPADGSTYNNEILHCVTKKAAGEAFSISHWAQSSNIKTQFNNFVNNTYAEDKADFYNQLDGKVETWYQSADPKNKWATADYSKHKGDIWYNDSTNKSYRWTGTAWVELKDQAAIDAKALAESKRRVFTTTTLPTPPYDAKDLWVQGENGDIMVCVTPKDAGATASASDWAKASKYTDDTAAKAAQKTANAAAAAAKSIDDAILAIDNNVDVALKDKIITKTEAAAITEALNSLSAIMADVTKTYAELVNNDVYKLIADNVRTSYKNAYDKLVATFNALSDYITNTLTKANPITAEILSTYNTHYTNFKTDYEAYVSKLNVVRNSMDALLNTRIGDIASMLGGLKATKDAMDETTQINGGLILSTLLALGYTDSGNNFNVMSGVSGLYEDDTEKGGGIAFWAGGHRIDINDCTKNADGTYSLGGKVVNPADFLVRHDGTGYAAGGALWWEKDGKVHADPQSFLINEQYVGNVMQLFKFVYSGGTAFENIVHAIPQKPFESLSVGANGLTLYNGENTAKLYIKNGVLFIEGDLAVTGGITMYASDGVKSGMIDQVYAVLDQSLFSIKDGVITITGEIGSGTVKGISIKGTQYDPDPNGIIALTLNWGDLTGVPTTFTPSAHTHDDRYYTESEIDTKLAGKADKATTLAGYGITDAYTKTETYTQTEVNTKLTDGSVTKVGKVDVGSATKPIYLKAGVPTAVGTSLAVDITGNSATTSKLKTAVTLWGQSFDGSKAIMGNLTNVGTITPTGEDLKVVGNLIVTGGIVMYADDGATIESGFAALLAAHIDGVTIKQNNQGKIYSVMMGIKVNGTTYKPSETDGYITIPDYPTSLDWENIENKPSTFTPSSHTHTFASLTSKPTTLSGYGITDAKIVNGVITLGTATITPLTTHQTVTLASGTNNGTLKLTVGSTTTDNIAVKGLGSAAYTASSAYAAASHTHSQYLVASSLDGYVNALTDNTSTNVFVTAISKSGKTLSYTKSFTKKSLTAASHSGWSSADTDKLIIPDMSFIAYWNGAYNSSGNSNLAYCNKGAFGDMATAAKSSYYTKTEVGTKLTDGSVTKLGTATVGSGTQHFYLNAGTATASTSTVGGTAKPIFLNAGTLTAISATVGSASKPVYLSGGSITACSYDFTSYLPLAGGTMAAGARISHADGNMYIGRSDNNGWVMCQDMCSQSGSTYWKLMTNGTFHSLVAVVSGNTSVGSLTINGINVTKSSDGILKIDGNLIVTGGITMYATDGVASGLMEQILVDGTTIGKKADGTLYAINTGNVRSIVMGSTTYTPNDSGAVTLPEKVTWANIEGKPSTFTPSAHTHSYLPLAGGTLTGALVIQETTSAASYAMSGGAFHSGYANIILRGNSSTGVSGIVFTSSKGTTNINQTSDRGFIQFHAHGVTPAAEGTDPTLSNSGEVNRLVIGVGNDGDDMVYIQTPDLYGLRHLVGTSAHVILDSGNFGDYAAAKSHTHSDYVTALGTNGNYLTWTKNGSTSNITVPYAASAGYANGIANKGTLDSQEKIDNFITASRFQYASFKGSNNLGFVGNDGMILSMPWGSSVNYGVQMAFDDTTSATVKVRGKDNSWGSWYTLLHSGNYNDYAPSKTGTGASGTWGINISGNAATATSAGNADTVDGEHSSAFAHIRAHNNLMADDNEFTFAPSGFSGTVYINWRTAGGFNGNITDYKLCNGAKASLGTIIHSGNIGSYNAGSATKLTSSAGSATLPIYFSDGKPVACTAASVFSNLSNSGNNISVTVAGQNRTLTVGYASNADKVDGYHADSFTKKHTEYNFNSNGTAPYNYVWLCRIGNSNGYSGMAITLDVNSRYHRHYQINMLISTGQYAYSSSYISINKSDGAPDVYYVRTANGSDIGYDYFDIYVVCGAWNGGGYKIANTNVQGALQFTNKCTLVDSLPSGATAVGLMYSSVNYATSAGNSDTCDGLHVHGGRNNEANKIVRTDGNGYLQVGYINSSSGDEGNNSSPARVWGTNGSDSYMRTYLTSALSVNYAASAGNADTVDGYHASAFATAGHNHFTRLDAVNIDTGLSHTNNWHYEISNATGTLPFSATWRQVYVMGGNDLNFTVQISTGLTDNNPLYYRHRRSGSWDAWRTILDSSNYNSYAPSKTGTGASGTWGISVSGNAATATTASKLGTANVGSGTQHFYLNGGTATASTSTVGGTAKPMYLKAGVMTAISDTVGGTAKPIFLNGGTLTAISTTAGSTTLPVYLNAGTITACGTSLGVSITGNAATASAVKDVTNSRTSYLNYGTDGVTSPSWLCAWNTRSDNTYEIRAISPANMLTVIKALPLAGGKLTGSLEINATASGSSYNEGVRIHPVGNWGGVILCEKSNSGSSGTSTNTWSIYNNEGTFGMYKNGATINASVCLGYKSDLWTLKPNLLVTGGITMYSDLRKKNILSDEVLSVKEIAAAPLFRHTYKSDDNQYIHVGTSAQYWSGIHEDWFTRKDSEGYYQMELQNLGVAMGISLAREIVTFEGAFKKYESKTDKKIRIMKKKINDLEARIKELEGSMEERRTV